MTGPTCEAVHDCSSFTLCTWPPLPFFFPRCKLTTADLKSKDQPTRVARVSCSVYSYPMRIQSLDKTYNKQQTNQNKKKEKRNKRKKPTAPDTNSSQGSKHTWLVFASPLEALPMHSRNEIPALCRRATTSGIMPHPFHFQQQVFGQTLPGGCEPPLPPAKQRGGNVRLRS